MENIKKLILEKGAEANDEEVCEAIFRDVLGELKVDLVSIWYFNDACNQITCRYSFDRHKRHDLRNTKFRQEDYPGYFKALIEDVAIRADDVLSNPKTRELNERHHIKHNICSALNYVIYSRDKPIAVLSCEMTEEKRIWKEQDVDYVRVLTVMAGAELKNK